MAVPQELFADEDLADFDGGGQPFGAYTLVSCRARGDTECLLRVTIIDVDGEHAMQFPRWKSAPCTEFMPFSSLQGFPMDCGGTGPLPDSRAVCALARAWMADSTVDGVAMGYVTAEGDGAAADTEADFHDAAGEERGPDSAIADVDDAGAAASGAAASADPLGSATPAAAAASSAARPRLPLAPKHPPATPSIEEITQAITAALAPVHSRLQALESRPPPPATAPGGAPGAVGPQLFDACRRAGLTAEQTKKLTTLAGPVPPTLKEKAVTQRKPPGPPFGPPVLKPPPLRVPKAVVVADEEVEEEVPHEDVAPAGGLGGLGALGQASLAGLAGPPGLQDITASVLLGLLKGQQDLTREALARQSSASSTDPLSLLQATSADGGLGQHTAGLRGIAARQLLHARKAADSSTDTTQFRGRLALGLRKEVCELHPSSLAQYFEEVTPFGDKKLLVYVSLLFANIWKQLEQPALQDVPSLDKVRAAVADAAVFCDQSAMQGGSSYQLGWLMTGLEEPVWDRIASRRPPKMEKGVVTGATFSRLADPRLVTTNLAYLEDLNNIAVRTTKTVPKKQEENSGGGGKNFNKAKGKKGQEGDGE